MLIAPLNTKELDKQFIKAAQDNQLDELKNLLNQGANILANDDEALRFFGQNGRRQIPVETNATQQKQRLTLGNGRNNRH